MTSHYITVPLTEKEARVIRRGLTRLHYEVRKALAKNAAEGWKPKPGSRDVGQETLEIIEGLFHTLPWPNRGDPS